MVVELSLIKTCLFAECSDVQLDIVMCLDTSGSVGAENVGKIFDFAKDVINLVDIENDNVRVAVIQFASVVTPIFRLNDFIQDKESMLAAIDAIEYKGGKTNTAGAMDLAAREFFTEMYGAREGAGKHMLVLTDGKPTIDPDNTIPTANYARQMGINTMAIAINMTTDDQKEMMEGIAGSKHGVLYIEDFDKLSEIFKKVLIRQCRRK